MLRKLVLFIKGMLMGTADVVPGVSGGTIAFVLGIYEDFIAALHSLNIRWTKELILFVLSGFKRKHLDAAWQHIRAIHWGFLFPLGAGMLLAIAIASGIVPVLIEEHPIQMRALFFGLVLASILVPAQALESRELKKGLIALSVAVLTFWVLGLKGSPPSRATTEVVASTTSLGAFSRLHPSLDSPMALWCPREEAFDNAQLRARVHAEDPATAAHLDELCASFGAAGDDVQALALLMRNAGMDRVETDPFFQVSVPAGAEVRIVRPSLLFILVSGAIAISAMVLPGISGSFMLLIIGVYEFVLSCLRGSIDFVLQVSDSWEPLLYAGVFALGAGLGVLGFPRVLRWLFARYREATLVALIGVMIGSLRVVWPFQIGSAQGGVSANVLPSAADPVVSALLFCALGFAIVVGLAKISERIERQMLVAERAAKHLDET